MRRGVDQGGKGSSIKQRKVYPGERMACLRDGLVEGNCEAATGRQGRQVWRLEIDGEQTGWEMVDSKTGWDRRGQGRRMEDGAKKGRAKTGKRRGGVCG